MTTGGCASSISARCGEDGPTRINFGQFDALPRARIGCLPFPGIFTLYEAADAESLGEHVYAGDASGETDRGIVYTCRAGFLDICHVRNSADMTAYIHARFLHAVRGGWTCFQFRAHEPSVYTVTINYPSFWWSLSPAEQDRLGEEAAIRASQQLAMTVMTWHELLTWYGYKSTVVISEKGSAFTYEDSTSHALGVLIAGDALRTGGDYNSAVTTQLDLVLADLGVVDAEDLEAAIKAVEGDWWANGSARKRHLETGSPGSVIQPWLVLGMASAQAAPRPLRVPDLSDVDHRDFGGFYSVAIDPRVLESGKILGRLENPSDRINPARDFPVLIADIRDDIGIENTRPNPEAVIASDRK